jgi:predicted phosphodiesterase
VVFGHQHFPYNVEESGVLGFSPGSPTDPRRADRPSYGILRVDNEKIAGEIVWL